MPQPVAQGTGRRKSSVARVRIYDGTGTFELNGRSLDDFFPQAALRLRVLEPLRTVEMEGRYDVKATLEGGGFTGQTDALRLGIARALIAADPDLRPGIEAGGAAHPGRPPGGAQEVRVAQGPPRPAVHQALIARPLTSTLPVTTGRLFGTDGVRGVANERAHPATRVRPRPRRRRLHRRPVG